MNKLAIDPDILEKVPQSLTNKIPLFEFEKNDELFNANENQQAASRIVTCSQINPFIREDKRMETNQSFNTEFNESPEIVLLNFKHLLFSFRWNQSLTINYLQWLVTVVNDCFFYFLKKSEPIYAFHVLAIADFYIKKVLHKSQKVGKMTAGTTLESLEASPRNQSKLPEARTIGGGDSDDSSSRVEPGATTLNTQDHFMSFVNAASRLMDPTQEIYCYQPGHPHTKKQNLSSSERSKKKELKKVMKAAEKMKLSNEFLKTLPY